MIVSGSEGTKAEAVFLGPSEYAGQGAVSVATAGAWTGAGREMGVIINTLTLLSPLLSSLLLVSSVSQIHLEARVKDPE